MPKRQPTSDEEKEPLYEELVQRVEQIVARLEDGSLGLNESLQQYEAGIQYLQRCLKMLDEAERKVALLTGVEPTGAAISEPFCQEADASLADKAERRSQRRSATSRDTLFDD